MANRIVIGLLLFFGSLAFFWNFKQVPSGYYNDSASNALNALCLSYQGTDEYGTRYPIAIRAFDDYRPPVFIYLLAVVSRFVPLELSTARLVGMVLSYLAVVLFFLFLTRLKEISTFQKPWLYGVSFFCVLLSSWVMCSSRMPIEYVTALFVVVPLTFLSWQLLQKPQSLFLGFVTGVLLTLCLYSYYGTKPTFFYQSLILFLFALKKEPVLQWARNHRGVLLALGLALLGATPTLLDLFGEQKMLARYRAIGGGIPLLKSFSLLWRHLDLRFFFFSGDRNWRHHTQFLGELNLFFLPFFLAGLYKAVKTCSRFTLYVLAVFILSFSGACVSAEGVPHALRTLPVLPPLLILCALGTTVLEKKNTHLTAWKTWAIIGILLGGANFYRFQWIMPKKDGGSWTSHYPMALPTERVPVTDHHPSTIDERYNRVLIEKDYRYCGS